MTDLFEFQNNTIKSCNKIVDQSGMMPYEINDILKETVQNDPSLKEFCEKYDPHFIGTRIYNCKTEQEVLDWYDTFGKMIVVVRKRYDEKKLATQEEKNRKELEWWKNHNRQLADLNEQAADNNRRLNDIAEDITKRKIRDQQRINEINRNKGDNPLKNESFDEKAKKQDIEDIEFKLRLKKVDESKINQELGTNDWREEIKKASDWRQAQQRRFDIEDLIEKQKNQYKCVNCGTFKSSFFPYERKGKKYCSYLCEKEDRQAGKIEASDISKIVKAFQKWMKKNRIEKISYSANGELVIQFSGEAAKIVEESKLTNEQKEIKSFFKANPQAQEIVADREYRDNSFPEKSKDGVLSKMTAGEITVVGLVIAGVVALVITLIVKVSRKQSQ